MFEFASPRLRTAAFALCVTAALVAGSVSSALAWELVPYETTATQIGDLNALMTPIMPLLGQGVGSNSLVDQNGTDNFSTANIVGSGNLNMLTQTGNNNRSIQSIEGQGSAQMLVQGGSNNNVLQASQGDNNFQAVGVSGSNNDIAYVQVGNELIGALNVTDSTNTTVVALQTGQHNYMMPSGLSGAQNKLIIVVPGRMYVLNK